MSNAENLIPFNERTEDEHRAIATKGGIKSGESRRQKKAFKELFENILSENGGIVNNEQVSKKEMVAMRAISILTSSETKDGDFLRAFEIVRNTIGEKPVEKIQVAEVSQDIIDEVERIVMNEM